MNAPAIVQGPDPRITILRLRALRREAVRREILRGGRIDLLASHVLGYDVRPFHHDLITFQQAAGDTCLQLAPRGFGKSTILTITRAIYEMLRILNVRIPIAANTQLQAEVFLREIKAHVERNRAGVATAREHHDDGALPARRGPVRRGREARRVQ
jgi:hypothetical protein